MDGGNLTSSFLLTARELRSTESLRFGTKANILEDVYLNTFISIDYSLVSGFSSIKWGKLEEGLLTFRSCG
jgi:hypothetical protein